MLLGKKLFLVILLSSLEATLPLGFIENYCEISKNHTMCKYAIEKPGGNCKGTRITHPSVDEKNFIVELHNKFRSEVARGNYNCCPPAADMNALLWDDELYKIAHRWVMQCIYEKDGNRNVDRFVVGQNIYRGFTGTLPMKEAFKKGIEYWFAEIKLMKYEYLTVKKTNRNVPKIGNFLQLVWSRTKYVGCALQFYPSKKNNSKPEQFYIMGCNYGPKGYVDELTTYCEGKKCSQCEEDQFCSNLFDGLCVKDDYNKSSVHEPKEKSNAEWINFIPVNLIFINLAYVLFLLATKIFSS